MLAINGELVKRPSEQDTLFPLLAAEVEAVLAKLDVYLDRYIRKGPFDL